MKILYSRTAMKMESVLYLEKMINCLMDEDNKEVLEVILGAIKMLTEIPTGLEEK